MTKSRTNSKSKRGNRREEQAGGPIARLPRRKEMTFRTTLHHIFTKQDISVPGLFGGNYFVMSVMPGAAALLAVFDQYRINSVEVEMIPQNVTSFIVAGTVATVAPTNVYNHNILISCVDTDDVTTPTAAIIESHESFVCHGPFVRPFRRTLVPSVAVEVYQTGGFGGYANRTNQWIDSASPDVQHYGFKYGFINGTTAPTATVYFTQVFHYEVEFRKVF